MDETTEEKNVINENLLRITGSAYVESFLNPSKTLNIAGELSIYSVEKRDNNDGTFNLINKAKFIGAVEVEQNRKTIRGIDKTKKSVCLRMGIGEIADELGTDREEFYQLYMNKLLANLNNVFDFLKDK